MNAILLGWVATSYLLAAAMSLVPLGRAADIYGRKRIFLYGVSIYTFASFLITISNSTTTLIIFRILQGVGSAMLFGTSVAILTSVFPIEERGKVLGINVAGVYLGLSLGPFLGGILTHYLGWRSIFSVNVLLGVIIIVVIFWKLKGEWAAAKGEKFDFIGSLVYASGLLLLMYGFSLLPKMSGIVSVLIAILGILLFIKWESQMASPILSINLFKNNTVFIFSNLAALINYCATSAVSFLLSLYLQYIKGLNPREAGIILVAQPIIMTFFSPIAGRLSDKIEPQTVSSIGMGLTTVGLFSLIFLSNKTALTFIIVNLIILGFGFAFFSSPNTNAIISAVEKRSYGVASGTLATMRLIGQMLSMGIVMIIFGIYIGRVQITPEYHPLFLISAKISFTIFAVLCFGGIFASLARGKLR